MNQETMVLGRPLTAYERSLRSWFRIVVSGCATANLAMLLAWVLCVCYAGGAIPVTTWLMWGFYAAQIGVMILFLTIQRPYTVAVHRVGAGGETAAASVLRAVSINTDNALIGLYEIMVRIFILFCGILLFVQTLLLVPFGGFAVWVVALVFVPVVSILNYASDWTIINFGIVRPRSRAMNEQSV